MCFPVEETLVTSSYKEHCLCELTSGRSQSKHVVTKAAASLLMVRELLEIQHTLCNNHGTAWHAWPGSEESAFPLLYFPRFSPQNPIYFTTASAVK